MKRFVIGFVFAFAGFFVVVYPVGAQTAAKADAKPASTQTATAAGRKTLTHDQLVAMLGNGAHQIKSVSETGTHYTLELKPDGTFRGDFESPSARRSATKSDSGKWEIKENQLCIQWNRVQQGKEKCLGEIVKSDSGEYRFEDGRPITIS